MSDYSAFCDNGLTAVEIESLLISAAQADANGKRETARWYRCWAATGRKIGSKPDETGKQYAGTAE